MLLAKADILNNIKTIIFDLGGVIIDLDVDRTIRGFSALSGFSPEKVKEIYTSHPVFHEFEKGMVTESGFREVVRSLFHSEGVSDDNIDEIWNGMLLSIPRQRLELMRRLKENYKVMILSNTNSIHVQQMYSNILPDVAGVSSFDPFVHKTYYSHDIRMRKPDAEIYQYVLDDFNLKAGETVFLDDNIDNVRGAEQLGIQVKHITDTRILFDLFS